MVTILISVAFKSAALTRREALIRGKWLFECGYPKVPRSLEDDAYLLLGAY